MISEFFKCGFWGYAFLLSEVGIIPRFNNHCFHVYFFFFFLVERWEKGTMNQFYDFKKIDIWLSEYLLWSVFPCCAQGEENTIDPENIRCIKSGSCLSGHSSSSILPDMWENFYMLCAPIVCRKSIALSPLQLWSDFPWAQTAGQGQGQAQN